MCHQKFRIQIHSTLSFPIWIATPNSVFFFSFLLYTFCKWTQFQWSVSGFVFGALRQLFRLELASDPYEIMECNPINLSVLRSFVLILRHVVHKSDSLLENKSKCCDCHTQIEIDLREQAYKKSEKKKINKKNFAHTQRGEEITCTECNGLTGISSRIFRIHIYLNFH